MKEGKIQDPFRMLDGMRGIAAPRERCRHLQVRKDGAMDGDCCP